ncbi:MAG: methionyl-tRNA formyltransferase [Woeseiaceae bacterium]
MSGRKILFAGTPDFALASLRALCDAGYTPLAVYTQPDRPAGRGRKLRLSPVKEFALGENIPVRQPETLKDADVVSEVAGFQAEMMIVAAYGLILPQAILDLPVRGCLNVHASLLPRWRGAAPIQAAILAGDRETGVSLMRITAGLDSGPVFAQQSLQIGERENAGELHDRLAVMGGEMLCQQLPDILDDKLRPEPQDESLATYAGKIRKNDASMDWHKSAEELIRQVRAYNPVPGAYFDLDGEPVKCWSAEIAEGQSGTVGTVIAAERTGIDVACAEGVLRMLELQRPGRQRVSAREFADQTAVTGKRLG